MRRILSCCPPRLILCLDGANLGPCRPGGLISDICEHGERWNGHIVVALDRLEPSASTTERSRGVGRAAHSWCSRSNTDTSTELLRFALCDVANV